MSVLILNSHILILIIVFCVASLGLRSADKAAFRLHALRWVSVLSISLIVVLFVAYSVALHEWISSHDAVRRSIAGKRAQVGLIGFVVGVVELVSRYKDNPPRALLTLPAAIYICLNVLACLAMLQVLQIVQPEWLFKVPMNRQQDLYVTLTAGFGAVALFRSSIFKLKTTDGEMSIGPAVVLDTLLAASDRAVDRVIATPRGTTISEIMNGISYDRAKLALPAYCFALMQNVSQQEQKDFGDQVAQLSASSMSDQVRSLSLGLSLLNIVGGSVLRSAVDALRPYIKTDPSIEQADVGRIAEIMGDVSFDKAMVALPIYCLALNPIVPIDVQNALKDKIDAINRAPVQAKAKSLMLGLSLNGIFGFPVTKLAVGQLGEDIRA